MSPLSTFAKLFETLSDLLPDLFHRDLAVGIHTGMPDPVSFGPRNDCMPSWSHSFFPRQVGQTGGATNGIKCRRSETDYHARRNNFDLWQRVLPRRIKH